jgi:HSP20 family molecular chaperone IbpA
MVDVLDEDDYYMVIAELPGVGETEVNWTIPGERELVIRAETGERKYARTIHLLERVQPQTAVSCYENGVLQLKLWKQAPR